MTAFKYQNPPIIEALCEIFFAGSEWDATIPGSFYQIVRDAYPNKREIPRFGLTMQVAQNQLSAQGTLDKSLIRFSKQDESQLIQLAENLLTINQLKPYCGYEQFQSDINKAVETYIGVAVPKVVERVGVRYINQITIPLNDFDSTDYIRVSSGVPEEVASVITGFATRIGLVARHPHHQVYVTLSTIPPFAEGSTSLLLDLYDTVQLHNDSTVDVIINAVIEAHDNVEHVFEGVITDKARALFGGDSK